MAGKLTFPQSLRIDKGPKHWPNFFFNETGKLGPSVFINENGSADVVNLRIVDIRWKKSVAHANGKCLSFFNVTEGIWWHNIFDVEDRSP